MVSAFELQSATAGAVGETDNTPEWIEFELSKHGSSGHDEALLARLGKKQLLKRNFDFVSIFAFTCLTLISWEGFYQVFSTPALIAGGPGSIIYGFLIILLGNISTFVSIGELASIAPTAGGQYHWVYMLGPVRSRKVLSYLTGWMSVLSWQALAASSMFTTGAILEGLLLLNYPNYKAQPWHIALYNWAWLVIAITANTIGSILMPIIQCAFLLVHVLGFIAIFIVLCYVSPHGSVEQVFQPVNLSSWPTQGLSTIVGLTSLVFPFLGADAAVHMSEEIHNASTNVPRSILVSILVNGLMGFAMAVPTVFGFVAMDPNIGDGTEEVYLFIPMFSAFTGNNAGGTVICSIILALITSCLTCIVATTSRMIWAFARDQGLPYSDYLSKIDKRTSGPLNAIILTTVISALLSLTTLGPAVAFSSLVSLGIAGFYSTYLACIGLLLWRRVEGSIKEPHEIFDSDSAAIVIDSGRVAWGPWRVKGWLGTANNAFACVYLLVIMFFSLWPVSNYPDATMMNYSVLGVALVLIGSLCFYMLAARRRYVGPVVEIVL